MFSENILQDAEKGDLTALVDLDKRGFLLGAEEKLEDYAKRLQSLKKNISEMENSLEKKGEFTTDDITVEKKSRIPSEILEEPREITEKLFGFTIDWVPGFFINPRLSLLFGGCAYYFFPDFFVLFIIRATFAKQKRWLIYRRVELLAHELCHVARIGMNSQIYEETFAYQTSDSNFRKILGGLFRSPKDSLGFLGSTFLLLGASLAQALYLPNLPTWPFWAILVASVSFLGLRHVAFQRAFERSLMLLEQRFGSRMLAVAFRCTDEEIRELDKLETLEKLNAWLEKKKQAFRWQVILARFGN